MKTVRKIRSKDNAISIIRATENASWCYKLTKLSPELRVRYFSECKEKCDLPEGEERDKWMKLYDVLIKYDRKQLLAMVGGDISMLRHAFSWSYFRAYQREKQRERRARDKQIIEN